MRRPPGRADVRGPPGGADGAPAPAPRGGRRTGARSARRNTSHKTASAAAKTGSQAIRSATQMAWDGAVCRPGSLPASSPAAVTARKAVWCQRNRVIADRLTVATAAQASGRRISRASGSRSSSARPAWAMPKVTTASVGGFRLEIAAPFTPTMLAGYPAHSTRATVAAVPPASMSAGPLRPGNIPRAQAIPSR